MSNRTNPISDATRRITWATSQVTRDIRVARITAGMTQRQVGRAVRRSASWVSRLEAGRLRSISVIDLGRVAAAVGLKLHLATFPGGRRPLDAPQLALLDAFNRRIHGSWTRELEVVTPIPGDLRAVDEVIRHGRVSCAIEAYTRLADVQRQLRTARTKQRDIGADRLILLVQGSHANRRMLHEAGPMLRSELPIGTREALRALAAGRDPGDDCLIVL